MDILKPFESVSSWWSCLKSAAFSLAKGVVLLLKSMILGAASLFLALWRLLSRCVGRYPSFALGAFLSLVFLVWLVTFMTMRARATGAEAQRDSISWQFSEFKEQHGYDD